MNPEAGIDRFKQISLAMEETVQIIETLDRISEGYRQLFQDQLLTLNRMVQACQGEGQEPAAHPEGEEIRRIILRALELSNRDPLFKSPKRPFPAAVDSDAQVNQESAPGNDQNSADRERLSGFVVPKGHKLRGVGGRASERLHR